MDDKVKQIGDVYNEIDSYISDNDNKDFQVGGCIIWGGLCVFSLYKSVSYLRNVFRK